MTIGFNEWRLSDDWSCDERHRDCLLPEVSSQRTPGPCWEQLSADLIEISQRKHGLPPCQVLGQAAVSHFGEAPQLLDYAKGVFAARPGPRTRPVDHPPARAQRPFRGRTPIDPVAHPPGLEKLSIVFLPVRLIAEDFPLLPVQQVRQLGDVGYAGSGRSDRMDDTAFIRADVQLHPEVPVATLAGLLHLGVAAPPRVLGRPRRRDDGRVHDGARAQQQPPFFQQVRHRIEDGMGQSVLLQQVAEAQNRTLVRHHPPFYKQVRHLIEDGMGQPVLLQQVAEAQNRTLVRHHLVAQLNPRETPHRLAVVDRIFGLWVRQIEPLLQEINPQHLLQSQRLATLAGFGVVRFDQPDQPRPSNHRIHLGQEPLAPRDFALPIPRQRCKRPLITHLLSSTSADPTNYLYPNRNTYAELP